MLENIFVLLGFICFALFIILCIKISYEENDHNIFKTIKCLLMELFAMIAYVVVGSIIVVFMPLWTLVLFIVDKFRKE